MNGRGQLLATWPELSNCRKVAILDDYEFRDAAVVARNPLNGLALLQTRKSSSAYATLRTGIATVGEEISAFTYPILDGLSLPLAVAQGLVRGSASPEGVTGILQISAIVDGQSAGGPITDGRGDVVGIIVDKLDKDWPSDVAYGIGSALILKFLSSAGVEIRTRETVALADAALEHDVLPSAGDYTVPVICFR